MRASIFFLGRLPIGRALLVAVLLLNTGGVIAGDMRSSSLVVARAPLLAAAHSPERAPEQARERTSSLSGAHLPARQSGVHAGGRSDRHDLLEERAQIDPLARAAHAFEARADAAAIPLSPRTRVEVVAAGQMAPRLALPGEDASALFGSPGTGHAAWGSGGAGGLLVEHRAGGGRYRIALTSDLVAAGDQKGKQYVGYAAQALRRPHPRLQLGLSLGQVHEDQRFFGRASQGARDLGDGALTSFVGAGARLRLPSRLTLQGAGSLGLTRAHGHTGSEVTGMAPALSSSAAASLERVSTFIDGDRLGLRVIQPMRVERADVTVAEGSRDTSLDLAHTGRQLDLEMALSAPLAPGVALNLRGRTSRHSGHDPDAERAMRGTASLAIRF